MAAERRTDDPVPQAQLTADVSRLLDTLADGGVGIVPLDVAYAVNATTEAGIKRIFTAKRRSYDKPSGMFANAQMSREIHVMEDWKHELVEKIIVEAGLPFSVVAPFRRDHPLFSNVEPFVLASSTKAGTLDMLLNAGQFHDEIARQAWERQQPVFGSSANTSLKGSKYRLADIEPEVRAAAAIEFDYGRSKYANDQGLSSTIIDFRDFRVIRVGVVFEQVADAFRRYGNVELQRTEQSGG
ncbi:MAG: hypothetical protein D6727_08380 [Gammaproteobacteria bacterium]|nr:MAG: hypothetical protein D6727_08380 [Gammaproteobacteria bacterium]